MPAFHAFVAPRAAPAPLTGAASASATTSGGDADLFNQALAAATQPVDPTLQALPPSRTYTNTGANAGYDKPDTARAAPTIPQTMSNTAQSAAGAATQTQTAANATTNTSSGATAVQSAAANVTTTANTAKASLKQQAAALKAQFQAQPTSTVQAALAGMQTTLQNAPGAVSASTGAAITDLLKQASAGVTGGPGATQAHLANLTQQLNRIEARATGVDPSAPPQGWTEPPVFAQARSLLNSLAGGTATTPAAMKASGDPLATAGLPIAGVANPAATTTAAANAQTTGGAVAQSAQNGQIAAALQATQATQAVGTTQIDPQMLKSASAQSTSPLSGAPQTPPKTAPRANANDRDTQTASTTTVADAQAGAPKTVPPPTPSRYGDNNAALNSQVADQTAAAIKDAKADDDAPSAAVASQAADAQAGQAQVQTTAQTQLQAQITAQAQAAQTPADLSHLAPQATGYLAAQMVKQLDGRSTQFDLQLHPADLGRVDVQMRIEQDGRLNAQLAFDNPAAAAEFRGRSDELRQQLQQAGFNVSSDSLTFTERDPQQFAGQQGGQGGQQSQSGWSQPGAASRAFRNSDINAQTADLTASSSARVVTGLDLRV
ncbi:MAG TPA: flagellar hook-length control protein FliK [Caulobacteraceae bacterium]|jgi:hypothetical protein|nr:flagellar hook-length control protein FliK [Caulobacteraceae bacterium]